MVGELARFGVEAVEADLFLDGMFLRASVFGFVYYAADPWGMITSPLEPPGPLTLTLYPEYRGEGIKANTGDVR